MNKEDPSSLFNDRDRRVAEIFGTIRQRIEREEPSYFLVLDLVSGDFEVNEDDYIAVTKIRQRRPQGEFWLMRANGDPAFRLGGSSFRFFGEDPSEVQQS